MPSTIAPRSQPTVSVCIPAFDAAASIEATLDSVWKQSYANLEVIVVDDGSVDSTSAILAEQSDPRLRVHRNRLNLGLAAARNVSINLARGTLIKFLDADDVLHRDCIAKMVDCLVSRPSLGMVFSRRQLWLENPMDADCQRWANLYGDLHTRFSHLERVNDGKRLFHEFVAGGFYGNWIAEPSGVMTNRAILQRIGGFHLRMKQNLDMDLWLRIMFYSDVGFLDEALFDYRVHSRGITGRARRERMHWLDTLWSLEGLRSQRELWAENPVLRARRRVEQKAVLGHLVRGSARAKSHNLMDALAYVAYVCGGRFVPSQSLYGRVSH
jgi:glycosyltransferase involved in cell wall biosynthesis